MKRKEAEHQRSLVICPGIGHGLRARDTVRPDLLKAVTDPNARAPSSRLCAHSSLETDLGTHL